MSTTLVYSSFFFFFNDTATTEIYTLSLHDALPIWALRELSTLNEVSRAIIRADLDVDALCDLVYRESSKVLDTTWFQDRKSTRLNSSHANISYAVFCLKKKKIKE